MQLFTNQFFKVTKERNNGTGCHHGGHTAKKVHARQGCEEEVKRLFPFSFHDDCNNQAIS